MKRKLVDCKSVPVKVTEETATKLDELVASLPQTDAYAYRRKATTDAPDVAPEARTATGYVSTRLMDRDREIVLPDGIDLEDYRANPVVLFGHDQARPCGKALWIKADDKGLIAKTLFPERPSKLVGEWLPDTTFELVKAEVLKGFSIGFLPIEIRDPEPDELAQFPDLQSVITRSLLLEFSLVSVPANGEALVTAIGKGMGLDLWNFKVVSKPKAKAKPQPKAQPRTNYKQMSDEMDTYRLDPQAIADQAIQHLLDRWAV